MTALRAYLLHLLFSGCRVPAPLQWAGAVALLSYSSYLVVPGVLARLLAV